MYEKLKSKRPNNLFEFSLQFKRNFSSKQNKVLYCVKNWLNTIFVKSRLSKNLNGTSKRVQSHCELVATRPPHRIPEPITLTVFNFSKHQINNITCFSIFKVTEFLRVSNVSTQGRRTEIREGLRDRGLIAPPPIPHEEKFRHD